MITRISLIIAFLCTALCGFAQSQTEIFEEIRKENPCSQVEISVLYQGKAHDFSVLGDDVEVDADQISANNLYEIGSISKVFCGILTQKAIAEEKLSLDTKISKVLPDSLKLPEDISAITVKQLLTHTSGLSKLPGNLFLVEGFDMQDPYANYDKHNLYPFLENYSGKLDNSASLYSNLGAGLLGHLLEIIYDVDYTHLVQHNIFTPLNMTSSTAENMEEENAAFLPVYSATCEATSAWNFKVLSPAGSIKSSLNDMKIFAKACLIPENHPYIEASYAKLNEINERRSNGSFWIIGKLNGHTMYGHSGRTAGSASSLIIVPDMQLAAIALNNSSEPVESHLFDLIKEITK